MQTTVGIAGISGKLAQCLVKELLKYPEIVIRGYCRSLQKLPPSISQSKRIVLIKGGYDDRENARKFVQGSDVVVCCYYGGPELMTHGQEILIDACEDAGVNRYIASDFAVDYTKIPRDAIFPKKSAQIVMEYLTTKKVSGVHILTGGLMETFWSDFFGLYNSDNRSISFWGTGDEQWDLTTCTTAAAYTAALALDRNAKGVFRFRGDRKSIKDIKGIFETVYGIPLHLKQKGSIDELYQTVEESFNMNPEDISSWAPM
ncbi:uncharacterized protein BHQ10_006156 [Talaromyces amestolkiae]|uniref:NAD(P)-binding domain-containing protein n=1 Tax=Talaromyces amestolkiae TaxID=1196081 RepID=A0A364L2Y6_TALAM|nr:uncharacterized protein BHQ10_006156 [Talaromyces amestolkiae]RAO70144.1 hypothetical protein BHQ10_006156 [Talaromyces amestolkiae]